ncbi:hypothetical protein QUF63_05355 [Anaerolineales bacterium HSG25]|nr:hypothetical protein [Anaerolineales bacterium HSG25]
MNTTAKGNAFENKVFNHINNELEDNSLGLNPTSCKVFKKKAYYSKDREADIIVDISIEVWLPNADKWSILWVWECKDLSKPLPVDDVEEFKAKLNQIGGVNIKGSFALTSSMQKGALNYAKNHGISVVRFLPDNQVKHIFYHMTPDMIRLNPNEFNKAITTQNFTGVNRFFYSIDGDDLFGDWITLFKSTLKGMDYPITS